MTVRNFRNNHLFQHQVRAEITDLIKGRILASDWEGAAKFLDYIASHSILVQHHSAVELLDLLGVQKDFPKELWRKLLALAKNQGSLISVNFKPGGFMEPKENQDKAQAKQEDSRPKTHTLHIKVPPPIPPKPGQINPVISVVDILKKVIEEEVVLKNWRSDDEKNEEESQS